MRKIANTSVCFGIAIILLFFGMSFDKADMLFYTQNERQATVESMAVYSGGASISEVESVMPQTMSAKSKLFAGQILSQLSSGKRDIREVFLVVPKILVSENNSACLISSNQYRVSSISSSHIFILLRKSLSDFARDAAR